MGSETPTSFGDGRYVVERPLGVGGMGSVWLARDRRFGDRLVAVKLVEVEGDGARAGRFLQRFRREARLLANLRHPNLVEVYDVDFSVTPPFLVMEYVEGEDLSLRLARLGPLDPNAVRTLLREQASALACLHDAGVVHRDLKPGNVLLDRTGRSRLTDLGLAFDDDATKLTREDSILGTVAYMAPEILRGEDASSRSDVFALGLVVHEAATGRNPVATDLDCHAYITAVLADELEPPPLDPSLPSDLALVIRSCLSLDPARRPADAGAVLALTTDHPSPTEPIPADGPAPTPPAPPPTPPPPRPTLRRLAPALLLLAAALPLALFHLHPLATTSPGPPPAPVPPASSALTLRRGLDLTELVFPSPPPLPATLRLETPEGELLVGRTVHDGRLLLRIPRTAPESDLRWSARVGGTTYRGVTHGGLRPDFIPAEGTPAPAPRRDMPPQPWVVVAGRLALTSGPDLLTLLRPDRSSGAPSRLAVDHALRLAGPDPRRHPVAGLGALGHDRLVLIERGESSGLACLALSTSGSLEPGPTTVWTDERVLGALTAPCPGGGLAVLMASRPVTDGVPGPRRVVAGTLSPTDPPRLSSLDLRGTVPLALSALDDDTLALACGAPGAPVTLMLVTRQGGTFRPQAAATAVMHGSGWWGPHLGIPLALQPDHGRAVFGLRNTLVVLETTGSVRRIPLGLDDTAVVGLLVPLNAHRVLAVAAVPAVPGISVPVSLYAVTVDTDPQAPPPPAPTFLASIQANLDGTLPLALAPVGDRFHLFVRDALLELDASPPFAVRRSRPVPGLLPDGVALVEGMVCLLDRSGRVVAYDPVEED